MLPFKVNLFLIFYVLFIVSMSSNRANAGRSTLHIEKLLRKEAELLESLPRGPVPPSGSSPCTYIPGQGGHCTLNEQHFAGGGAAHPPPPFEASLASDEVKEKDYAS